MTRFVLVGFSLLVIASAWTCRSDSTSLTVGRAPTPRLQEDAGEPIGPIAPPGVAVSPRLRSATVNVAPRDRLLLTVRFMPGTFTPGTTSVQFVLNPEQAASTRPPAGPGCGEYLIDIGEPWGRPDEARVSRLVEAGRYELVATVPARLVTDGIDLRVSLSALGTDVAPRSFRVTAFMRVDDNAVSPILDSRPEAGAPPAAVGRLQKDPMQTVPPVAPVSPGAAVRPFVCEEASFSVRFPGTPIYDTVAVAAPEGPQVLRQFRYAGDGVVYFVTHTCTPPTTLPEDPDQALDFGRDAALQMAGSTLVSEERVSVNGHRGTRLVARLPGGGTAYGLIVIGSHGNYYSLVAGPRSPAATSKALAFLDSFSVLRTTSKSWCQAK